MQRHDHTLLFRTLPRALALALPLALLGPALATAQVRVEPIPLPSDPQHVPDEQSVDPEVERAELEQTLADFLALTDPTETALQRAWYDAEGVFPTVGVFVDTVDPGAFRLRFRDPEIRALAGASVDGDAMRAMGRRAAGGLVVAQTLRPTPFLRLPEFRLYLGGGGLSGDTSPATMDPRLGLRPTHFFMSRFEVAVGLQVPLGPVTPHVLLRGARARYAMTVQVEDEQLGRLGTERIAAGRWEAGFEAGIEVRPTDYASIALTYRRGWVGPARHGGSVNVAFPLY